MHNNFDMDGIFVIKSTFRIKSIYTLENLADKTEQKLTGLLL